MHIEANVNYHVKKSISQAFEFDVNGIVGNLVAPELEPSAVQVTDLRHGEQQPDFHRDGIEFIETPSQVADFDNGDDWQAVLNRELTELLQSRIGATEVIVFDHTVRIDDPQAPRRPARNVHIDYSQASAEQRLIDLVGEDVARSYHKTGFGFVNAWRPIQRVITSSPLGFIRATSIEQDDLMAIGLVYPDRLGEIVGVAANPSHQWFYRSAMDPDEVVIFNLYDNHGRPRMAHSALDLPGDAHATVPRMSIESRTLVKYS
jgi:hypothetical protein